MPEKNLIFVDDSEPGISRRKYGRGYAYYMPDGTHIADAAQVDRLNGLAVPPAYQNCWFCPLPNGHLQATGYDDRKRKQYRYHVQYREERERQKFSLCKDFGEALPALRKQVAADMRKHNIDRDHSLAAIVRLLDTGLLRIGNDQYTRSNKSYGATTLLEKQVEANSSSVMLDYRAKSGKQRQIKLSDRSLARFIQKLSDLPGQRLFQYEDDKGKLFKVGSSDVNAYIQKYAGEDFSAKHFRTFGASRLAFGLLATAEEAMTIKALTQPVADALGNTQTMARKSYIHPDLIDLCGKEPERLKEILDLPRKTEWLSREERGLIAFL